MASQAVRGGKLPTPIPAIYISVARLPAIEPTHRPCKNRNAHHGRCRTVTGIYSSTSRTNSGSFAVGRSNGEGPLPTNRKHYAMDNQIHRNESTIASPWSEFSDQRRASARKYRKLRNELGLAFREAQQEAYRTWCWWEQAVREDNVDRASAAASNTIER
jgi:hypothetical protein